MKKYYNLLQVGFLIAIFSNIEFIGYFLIYLGAKGIVKESCSEDNANLYFNKSIKISKIMSIIGLVIFVTLNITRNLDGNSITFFLTSTGISVVNTVVLMVVVYYVYSGLYYKVDSIEEGKRNLLKDMLLSRWDLMLRITYIYVILFVLTWSIWVTGVFMIFAVCIKLVIQIALVLGIGKVKKAMCVNSNQIVS